MIKLLVADENKEMYISSENQFKALGFSLVGVTKTMKEAFALGEKFFPDVIVTNSSLSDGNGLDLIRKLKFNNPTIKAVVVSEKRDFDEALKALKLGVKDFLEYPFEPSELLKILENIADEDNPKAKSEHLVNIEVQLQQQQEKCYDTMYNKIIKSLMAQPLVLNKNHFDFFTAVVIKIDVDNFQLQNMQNASTHLCEQLDDFLQSFKHSFQLLPLEFGVLLIFQSQNLEETFQNHHFKTLLTFCKRAVAPFDHHHITIGVGDTVKDASNIVSSIKQAIDAVKSRLKLGLDHILFFCNQSYSKNTIDDFVSIGTIKKMDSYLESFETASIIKGIKMLFDDILSVENYSPSLFISGLEDSKELLYHFYKRIKEDNISINHAMRKLDEIILFCNTESQMYHKFIEEITNQIEVLKVSKEANISNNLKRAKRFVQEHYHEKISLSIVANAVSMNETYLSVCFKQQLKISYISFLTTCRINAAKQLLQTSQMNISEIAFKIGYSDPKYFSKLFEKNVGVKPSVFRKFHT